MPSGNSRSEAILQDVSRRYPDEFPRRVLLAVAGMSPQVITETLFALGHGNPRPFHATEVVVVTTSSGRQRILLELLGEDRNWFDRLYRDYPALPRPRFQKWSLRTIGDGDRVLEDIRGEGDNAVAADAIAECVREFTADSDCALHVSIAGGRKTMGYFAGSALSLYGRAQDRLSHVLVSEQFESHPEFFYPAPRQRVIHGTRDGAPLDAQGAEITLADIPFVRLREVLPSHILEHPAPFREAIEHARLVLEPPTMEIDMGTRLVRIGARTKLARAAELAFFLWIWGRQQSRKDPIYLPPQEAPVPGSGDELAAIYCALNENASPDHRTRRSLAKGLDGKYFLERVSLWNAFLQKSFGQAGDPFRVESKGKRPETRYTVRAAGSQVVIVHRSGEAEG